MQRKSIYNNAQANLPPEEFNKFLEIMSRRGAQLQNMREPTNDLDYGDLLGHPDTGHQAATARTTNQNAGALVGWQLGNASFSDMLWRKTQERLRFNELKGKALDGDIAAASQLYDLFTKEGQP